MPRKAPNKKKRATQKQGAITHKLGDVHFLGGLECSVKLVNTGIGFLFPTTDDEDFPLIAKHICYAKIYDDGEVVYLSKAYQDLVD